MGKRRGKGKGRRGGRGPGMARPRASGTGTIAATTVLAAPAPPVAPTAAPSAIPSAIPSAASKDVTAAAVAAARPGAAGTGKRARASASSATQTPAAAQRPEVPRVIRVPRPLPTLATPGLLWPALAFLAGVGAVQLLPELPALAPSLAALAGLALARCRHPFLRLPLWLAAGMVYAAWRAALLLAVALPAELEGQTLQLRGTVLSEPRHETRMERFEFAPDPDALADPLAGAPAGTVLPPLLRLAYYPGHDAPRPHLGERWSLAVRLRRPVGMQNPGGFDYERWLFAQRIGALGRVLAQPVPRPLADEPGPWLPRLRHELAARAFGGPAPPPEAPVLAALTLGLEGGIPAATWEVFRRTGTAHLVAISGMHISLLAALVYFLSRRLWSWLGARIGRGLVARLPAPRAAAFCALISACGYALLAGWSVPTQRAVVMVACALAPSLWGRRWPLPEALAAAMLGVLLFDPLAVLGVGMWLSFGAVALLFYAYEGRTPIPGLWWHYVRIHWVMAVGLAPILLYLFGQQPNLGPLANLVAVPWVNLVVIPLAFLAVLVGAVSPTAGQIVAEGAAWAFAPLAMLLEALARTPGAVWRQGIETPWPLLAGTLGALILFMPRGLPGRWLAAVLFLPLLTAQAERPLPGQAWITVLDVGQGLAVVVEMAAHTLIFDTGPRLGADLDAGTAAIVPYLAWRGVAQVDRLVVSHGDADHSGGLPSLLKEMEVLGSRIGPDLPLIPPNARPCRAGERWEWEGVRFAILHPEAGDPGKENDRSCVLRVATATGAALLPADIEAAAEALLVARYGAGLRADLLVAPHHGSRTSSTLAFLQAVRPRHIVYSAGYKNRFHHPAAAVVARSRATGAQLHESYRTGALRFVLGDGDGPLAPVAYRETARRYYHARFGAGPD